VKYPQVYSSPPTAIAQILMERVTTYTKQDELRICFVLSDPKQQISDGSQINLQTLSHANKTHSLYAGSPISNT
jgi:hypothetical protein